MADVKFCGLTRPEDAALAGALGAAYVGVIFAGGPRQLDAPTARDVLDAAGEHVARVGVFGTEPVADIAAHTRRARLEVVQLHADPTPGLVHQVRAATGCAVWAAVRIAGRDVPPDLGALAEVADAVVLDARVPNRLGGTGVTLPWAELARVLPRALWRGRFVLAGGLEAGNVAAAVAALGPDVVDVSSGVESSAGIKDPSRMRAFASAVRAAGHPPARA